MDKITFEEYQKGVARTSVLKDGPQDRRMHMTGMGIVGEVGEFCDLCKKSVFHSHPLDYGKMEKEIGDILYYVAEGCNAHDVRLADVMKCDFEQFENDSECGRSTFPKGQELLDELLECCLRLGRLSGDYADYVHERLINGQPPMPGGTEILGDILSEVGGLCYMLCMHVTDVAIHNREKLEKRYPSGFESNRSINREENVRG